MTSASIHGPSTACKLGWPGDSDAALDLQSLINAAWENGGYDDTDYRIEPVTPLLPEDSQWAAGVL
jgi:hypothetical protein